MAGRISGMIAAAALALSSAACVHPLTLADPQAYERERAPSPTEQTTAVRVERFEGQPDDLWFYNTLVEELEADRALELRSTAKRDGGSSREAPLRLKLSPHIVYRSSWTNLFVNWPGLAVLAPAWHGYRYRAYLILDVRIGADDGTELDAFVIPMTWEFRHADPGRVLIGTVPLLGSVYCARVFDRDAIADFQLRVRDSYRRYAAAEVRERVLRVTRRRASSRDSAGEPPSPSDESLDEIPASQ